jgi:hypothetical protein
MAAPDDDPFANPPDDPGKRDREDPFLDPPPIDDPDAGALPPVEANPPPGLDDLGGMVDQMKAADAPPIEPVNVEPPSTFQPPKNKFDSELKDILAADRAPAPGPSAFEPPPAAGGVPPPAAPPGVEKEPQSPSSFSDFLRGVSEMKRADGSPIHPNAAAKMKRAYQRAHADAGMEPPPGMEALEIESRESEAGFVKADRDRFNAETSLLSLLTQNAIEMMRRLSALENALLRNRQ